MSTRWKMSPKETGLRSVACRPRSYHLMVDREHIATVAAHGGGALNGPISGWYFYGMGHNSLDTKKPFATVEEAKAAALKFYKDFLKKVRA